MSRVQSTRTVVPEMVTPTSTGRLVGQVVYMYAFDIAYEMKRFDGGVLLGQQVGQFKVDASKRTPRQLFFHRPQMVRLPPVEKFSTDGTVRLEFTVKLLPVGAISLTCRLPFEVDRVEDLVDFHDLRFSDGRTMHDEAREIAEQVRVALMPYLIKPRDGLSDEEAYTVFCIETPERHADEIAFDSDHWLTEHRRGVAGLLTEEPDLSLLSDQEVHESTAMSLSYSRRDLVVYDWDAALVIDESNQFDQILHVIELANVQLTELEAYDRLLDAVVDRAYGDLGKGTFRRLAEGRTQRELREIRVDLARLTDELGNITKFFGDWHAARLYQGLFKRFHLDDWHRTIDHKLQTLDHIYGLIAGDRTARWMLVLEATIVFLILFDIVKAFVS